MNSPPSTPSTESHVNPPRASETTLAKHPVRAAFWAALLVRVAYLTFAHTYRIRPFPDHFEYGWEMGRIARALATGHGYADPFLGHTGPTAWVTPLYPLLIAFVFKLTGVYTAASAWILLTLNSLFSALTVYPIAAIAQRSFADLEGRRAASIRRWAVWLWALYPAAMQYAVRWVWETSLSTLLFTCAVALALRMHQRFPDRPARFAIRDWVLFGLVWGAIALANPALVLFLPFAGIWILTGDARSLQRGFVGATLSALVFLAVLAPWVVRNTRAFHHFVPLRANFGAELCLGNCPGATGLLMEYDHPAKDPRQLRLYTAMGEHRYAQMRGALAKQTIRADRGLFVRNTLKRLDFFWFGVPATSGNLATRFFRSLNYGFISTAGLLGLLLALRRKVYGAWVFAFAFLTLPAVYYFVTVHARFRHPLEPLIAVLAVYLFQSGTGRPGQ
ncbi:MAG: ArnT family glycosyltransferase [Acidobacteriaceae bacterium]